MNESTRVDPARELYALWDTILSAYGNHTCGWGPRGWGIWRNQDTGGISYGQLTNGWPCHWFNLLPDGRFKVNHMFGSYRRSGIAQGTFLGYGFTHSRYQWFVHASPSEKHTGWNNTYRTRWRDFFTDWNNPVSYVSEDLLGVRSYRQTRPWLTLARDEWGAWEIVPALDQVDPEAEALKAASYEQEHLWSRWNRWKKTCARRRFVAENQHRVKNGLDPKVSARTPTIRSAGQVLSPDQAVRRLAALLEVSQPAKTTPLRPKEAPDGADNLAAPIHP